MQASEGKGVSGKRSSKCERHPLRTQGSAFRISQVVRCEQQHAGGMMCREGQSLGKRSFVTCVNFHLLGNKEILKDFK